MAKKKKTRKQKILAGSRKNNTLPIEETAPSSPNTITPNELSRTSEFVFRMKHAGKISTPRATVSATHDYTHLKRDLIKTGILTTSIVIAQLVLYFILK